MGETPPDVLEWDELRDWDAGEWELRLIREVLFSNNPFDCVLGT